MTKVLVLNASYEPLNTCSWRRAIVLVLKGKAEQLECENKIIYSSHYLPTVIRLRNFVKIPYKEINLSRKNVLHRDNYTCQYCGVHKKDLTVDHIIPKSKGGKDTWDNVITACLKCNVSKGNKTPKEANMQLRISPRRPQSQIEFEISKFVMINKPVWSKYIVNIDFNA